MERLVIKKSKRDIIIEPFDMDNEIPFTVDDGDEETCTYFTVKEVYTIVEYLQTQLLELEKLKT